MILVKGFYSVPKLSNNSALTTAVFGELSQYASTFSRDYKTFTRGSSQLNFCAFSVKSDGNKTELGINYSSLACEVGDWIYNLGLTFSPSSTRLNFIQALQDNFGNKVKNVNCGNIISNINLRMPSWVSWETDTQPVSHFYKIWITGAAFETEYDDYEIFVVPPVQNINSLFQPYPDLVVELAKNDISAIHTRLTAVRNRFPETVVYTEMVELIDGTNSNNKINVGWTALIYGPSGNSTDNVKQAIINYILSNSNNVESDWRLLMPDLFNTTCFYVIPRWSNFATPPRIALPGIFSPVVNAIENFNFVKNITSSYISTPHLTTNLETTIHRYKDISLSFIGGEFNRLNLFKFTDYFSDYNAQESTNEDFNRQKQSTKDLTNLLTLILKKIDNWETDNTVPASLRVLTKFNQKFIVGKLNNVEFLVLMKPTHQP